MSMSFYSWSQARIKESCVKPSTVNAKLVILIMDYSSQISLLYIIELLTF